jgi:hypothetical protein
MNVNTDSGGGNSHSVLELNSGGPGLQYLADGSSSVSSDNGAAGESSHSSGEADLNHNFDQRESYVTIDTQSTMNTGDAGATDANAQAAKTLVDPGDGSGAHPYYFAHSDIYGTAGTSSASASLTDVSGVTLSTATSGSAVTGTGDIYEDGGSTYFDSTNDIETAPQNIASFNSVTDTQAPTVDSVVTTSTSGSVTQTVTTSNYDDLGDVSVPMNPLYLTAIGGDGTIAVSVTLDIQSGPWNVFHGTASTTRGGALTLSGWNPADWTGSYGQFSTTGDPIVVGAYDNSHSVVVSLSYSIEMTGNWASAQVCFGSDFPLI